MVLSSLTDHALSLLPIISSESSQYNRVGGSARYSQHPCRVYHLHKGNDHGGDEGDQREGEHHLKFVVHDAPMTL